MRVIIKRNIQGRISFVQKDNNCLQSDECRCNKCNVMFIVVQQFCKLKANVILSCYVDKMPLII